MNVHNSKRKPEPEILSENAAGGGKVSAREQRLRGGGDVPELDPQKARKRRLAANGTYAAAMTALILIGVLLVNLVVQALPRTATTFDLTNSKLYSIGETTKTLLSGLEDEVTITILTESGQEDTRITRLVERYAAASPLIKTETVDVIADPTYYRAYTDTAPSVGSIVVTSGERSRVIDYYDLYQYSGYYSTTPSAFDGEGQLTSAVAYVTSAKSTKLYYTTGHDEFALDAAMTAALEKANIETEALNLLGGEIPEDCGILLAFAPVQDFTAAEAAKVSAYLSDGGHALLVSAPPLWTGAETPKYESILASYGISSDGGIVMEGDPYYYDTVPYLVIPNLSSSHETTAALANQNVVAGFASGIEVSETEDLSFTVEDLLTTTDRAYLKTRLNTTYEQEDGDETGTYTLGVAVAQTFSNDSQGSPDVDLTEAEDEEAEDEAPKETRLLYFTTPTLFNSDALSALIGQTAELPQGNQALFSKLLSYLTDQDAAVSVAAKTMDVPQTTISSGIVGLFGNLLMFGLPALVLAGGIVIFVRRRKR